MLPVNPVTQPNRLITTLLAVLFASDIQAESQMPAATASLGIEEMRVTASRRVATVQQTPLAISALSGDFIRAVNLDDVKDLTAFTPGLTGNSKDSYIDALSIRGISTNDFGIGGDPSVSIFKNNIYQGA